MSSQKKILMLPHMAFVNAKNVIGQQEEDGGISQNLKR